MCYAGGVYYSPALGRPLQQVNPGGSGGGGGGINNSVASSQGSGGGLSAADGAAQAGGVLTAGLAAYGAAGAFAGVDSAAAFAIVSLAGPIAWAVMGVTAAILGILDLFDVFGGGGTPVILPAYRRIAHQVQSEFIGSSSVAPNMDNSFNYEAPFGGRVIFVGEPEGHFYLYNRTLPRYKYCGPGNYPVQPNGATDRCCQAHDNCYGANGISSRDVKA